MSLGLPDVNALLDVGPMELIILVVIIVALLLLGPTKIPELARGIGRAMGEVKRGRQEIEREIQRELYSGETQVRKIAPSNSVLKAARELGVDVEGRPESEVKLDIVRAMDRQESPKVISAARVLGVSTEGVPLSDIKMNIIRSIGI